jgi:hypothetical protein
MMSLQTTDVLKTTNYIQFATENKKCLRLNICFNSKLIEEVEANIFLGLQIDSNLNWKKRVEYIIIKPSSECFALRTGMPLMTIDTLKLVYIASTLYCHMG